MPRVTTPCVTISGYYGFGNAGDEAVLAGLVQSLRAEAGDLDICALSIAPQKTRAAHGISAAHRYHPSELIPALLKTDLLLSGGGSLLQDVTSAHGIFYYLGIVRLAQMLGKRTMFAAQGIGPLVRPRSRKLTAAVANRVDAITVRDPASAALLREIGVTRPSIEVVADPALLLSPPAVPVSASFPPQFAVALRAWPGHANLGSVVADACRRALPPAAIPVLVPMQPTSDTDIGEQFAAERLPTDSRRADAMPLASLMETLASCEMVVGMRLHALILAAACGVPSVALSYDPKVAAFMMQSGQADTVKDLKDFDADALAGLLAQVWETRQARAEALRARLPALRALARRTAQIARGLL